MRAKIKIRTLRALAIAASLSAIAVPTTAGAKPVPADVPIRHENSLVQQHQQPYSPPAGFRTEVQTASKEDARQPFTLPSSFKPEVQTTPSPVATSPVVREIRTVTIDDSHTLAIVLAAIALTVAVLGSGYALVRLTQVQRTVLETSSTGALVSRG